MIPTPLSAPVLTIEAARTRPLAELATTLLGEAGKLVVDVERPPLPACVLPCSRDRDGSPHPPLLTQLTFYTRASAIGAAGWLGLCRASSVIVTFGDMGEVTHLYERDSVGSLGSRARGVPSPVPAASAQRAAFEANCRALPTTRAFVATPDLLAGPRVLIAVSLIHDSMATGGPIRVTCDGGNLPTRCATPADLRALAPEVTMDAVTGFDQIDPETHQFVTGGSFDGGCYRVRLRRGLPWAADIAFCAQDRLGSEGVTRVVYVQNVAMP